MAGRERPAPKRSAHRSVGGRRPAASTRRRGPLPWPVISGIVLVGLLVVGFVVVNALPGRVPAAAGATPWATLGTRDVHALAFDPSDPAHLYFGHHTGLLESRDGGRSWHATGLSGADAMNVRITGASTLQIAGHHVYRETSDGGRTWTDVPNDLPGLDLHAFAVDPADAAHVWAYAAGFGLFESHDRGRHWARRQTGDWPVLATFRAAGVTTLIGVSAAGVGASTDGGATWRALGAPDGELASLAATPDGSTLLAGTTRGLVRSEDGGMSWRPTGFTGTALTIAVAPSDSRIVALVDEQTRFFRSDDAGATWPGPR